VALQEYNFICRFITTLDGHVISIAILAKLYSYANVRRHGVRVKMPYFVDNVLSELATRKSGQEHL
jgi:hypothetical protein